MIGSILLDLLLVALLVAYFIFGYRTGLIRSLGGIVGVVIGAFIAILLVPLVTSWVTDPTLRTLATVPESLELAHKTGAIMHGTMKDLDQLKRLYDLFAETLNELCRMGSAYERDPDVRASAGETGQPTAH